MLKEYIRDFKEKVLNNNEGNNKKKIENLAVFVIILIITVVMINYIWNGNSKTNKENIISTKVLASENNEDITNYEEIDVESKLENILSKIKGVGSVKVLLTYSQTSVIVPMYSEDISQTTTEETDSGGGKRTVNEKTNKKDVVYEENSGSKIPVIQSTIKPTIEGAIITAKGAENSQIKASIIQAVEAATGLGAHKIQVFEME